MKLKVDSDGKPVYDGDKLVFVKDDGTENPYDVGSLVNKISDLNRESAKYRTKAKEANTKLEAFEGIDPEEAKTAIKTVKDLDDKKLIDAGEANRVKAEMVKGYKKQISDLTTERDSAISKLNFSTIQNHFANSDFIKEKTNLSPDIAATVFGDKFTVDNGVIKTKDNIMSKLNPGDPAGFDEALGIMIDNRSDKSSILKTNGGGSGGQSNSGGGTGSNPFKDGSKTEQAALIKNDPVAAKAMAKAAGVDIPGLTS